MPKVRGSFTHQFAVDHSLETTDVLDSGAFTGNICKSAEKKSQVAKFWNWKQFLDKLKRET